MGLPAPGRGLCQGLWCGRSISPTPCRNSRRDRIHHIGASGKEETARPGRWTDYAKRNPYPKNVRLSRSGEQDANRRGLQFPNDSMLPTLEHALENGWTRPLSASPSLIPVAGLAEVPGIGGKAAIEADVLLAMAWHQPTDPRSIGTRFYRRSEA